MNIITKNKTKVLVIIPHQDDELNLVGDLIQRNDLSPFVVYTTNGDYSYRAETRFKEVINALTIFEVPEEQIIFLGYGDTLNSKEHRHIFYSYEVIESNAGHLYTYGTPTHEDYSYKIFHKHQVYTQMAYRQDLTSVILRLMPDIIFCIDFDVHADHRMASISFEKIIGNLLEKSKSTFTPIVYKGFAYTTGFNAVDDFYRLNLLEVKPPQEGSTPHYYAKDDLLNHSIYLWHSRVRFPVNKGNRTPFLLNNSVFQALCCHKSQSAGLHACQIINSDKVFWQRRTDSCSYYAQIKVSSNFTDAHYLNDFQLYNTDDIDSEIPVFNHYAWIPDKSDVEKKITFTWDEYQEVQRIVLYGLLDQEVHIQQVEIEFDNGEKVVEGPVPGKGIPLSITLHKAIRIKWCSIKILQSDGKGGFAECEFFATERQKNNSIKPFIKILDQDNFIYDYLVPATTNQLQLKIYYFECQGTVTFKIIGDSYGAKITEDGKLDLNQLTNKITVKAYLNDSPDIQDTITVRKVKQWETKKIHFLQQAERLFLTFLLRLNRKYIYLRKKYINDI
mgnify:CR=1 FL=1